ncbi:RDD family protein [Terrarubrum flagellatum]|uniref:RDD family protein n=1 Tax=Terrirubrum flagellatum TaxID=2895980 RepID=UPI0031451CCD
MRGDFHDTLWSTRRKRAQTEGPDALSAPIDDLGDTQTLVARACAFGFDFLFIALIGVAIFVLVAFSGIFTFGLSWLALPLVFPLTAFFYNAFTMSGPGHGTWGMRAMGLEAIDVFGRPLDFLVAGAHAVLFYVSMTFPPVLLVGLFNSQHRLLHDFATGVVIRKRP